MLFTLDWPTQVWEKAICLCKELAELYENRLFDYTKLSQILTSEAKFFDNILTQLRPEPEYFRVGFFGRGFPLFVRVRFFTALILDAYNAALYFYLYCNLYLILTRTKNSSTEDWNMKDWLHSCKESYWSGQLLKY